MKISASYDFSAAPEKVWDTLTDPKSLSACIPGCESLEEVGENEYQAKVTVSMGPIRNKFDVTVKMLDQKPFESYTLIIEGKGPSGFVRGESHVSLVASGGKTIVNVEADSSPGGLLARVGQRMMENVARSMMNRFFTCLQESVN